MKKVFIKFSAPATLALALALGSCNNAEEVKKQVEAQATQIQTAVDEQLNGLQEQVNAECTALVDSLANVQYEAFLAEAQKVGKKVVAKVKPKVPAKKEEPAKTGIGAGKVGMESTPAKIGDGKIGTTQEPAKLGKGKVGVQAPPK